MVKRQTKSKKPERKKEEFLPGIETEEQFEKVLSLLSEWMKAGIVSITVDVEGDVAFELPREMDKLLKTQVPSELTHEKVVAIISNEIPALVSAGLEKNPKRRLRFTIPEKLHDKIDVLIRRGEKAVSSLVNKSIKERILLRKATPGYVVDDIRSIASTYHVESKKGEKVDVPFISLELTLARPHSVQMFTINPVGRTLHFTRKDDIKVVVDLHKDDIKDLIQKLQKIEEEIGE